MPTLAANLQMWQVMMITRLHVMALMLLLSPMPAIATSGAAKAAATNREALAYPWSRAQLAERQAAYDAWATRQPAFNTLLEQAVAKFGLTVHQFDQWMKDARRSAWLPKVLTSYDLDFDQKSAIVIEDTISVTSTDITVGPPESQENYNIARGQGVTLRMQWDLAPLIYHRDQLLLERERHAVFKDRLSLARDLYDAVKKREALAFRYYFMPDGAERLSLAAERHSLTAFIASLTDIPLTD